MTLTEILLTILIQVLFCLGLRTILSEGQIFHFIREPFEYDSESKVMNFLKRRLQRKALRGDEGLQQTRRNYVKLSNRISVLMKPFVICVICFSSVWGGAVFIALHGLHLAEVIFLIISCISTAFILKVVNDKVDW